MSLKKKTKIGKWIKCSAEAKYVEDTWANRVSCAQGGMAAFWVVLASHLACAHIWSDSGPSCVGCISLSQGGFHHRQADRDMTGLVPPPLLWGPSQTEDLLCMSNGKPLITNARMMKFCLPLNLEASAGLVVAAQPEPI